jgi:hypothetical protein
LELSALYTRDNVFYWLILLLLYDNPDSWVHMHFIF